MFIDIIKNIDFIIVSTSSILMAILSIIVLFSNRRSATNKNFLYLSIAIIIWSFLNYLSYQFTDPILALWLLRFVVFGAVWFAFFIFQFLYIFPREKVSFSKLYKFLLVPIVFGVAILTLTPFVFVNIEEMPSGYRIVPKATAAIGIIIFGLVVSLLNVGGIVFLFRKWLRAKSTEKKQILIVFLGLVTTITLIIIFNFIFPVFFGNQTLVVFGALFTFPFIAFTSYAILKHGLFNVKVIATELLVFAIWIIILVELLIANTLRERILDGGVFLFVFFAGVLLIRSVKKEVKQREDLEVLTHELKHANEELRQLDKAKSEFISIASHQLRTPLSVTKGYVSMILEGIYGDVSDKIKDILQKVFIVNEGLIDLVNNLLDLSRMEAGTLKYEFKDINLVGIIDEIVMELELEAKHRNLSLTWQKPQGPMPMISADSIKLKQVIEILIENSLKYTPNGGVDVSLAKENNSLLFKVKDTGIGLDPKELEHLFNKFGRGVAGSKINAGGVGLGLYTAKQIVLAHKGEIWAESEGPGKGSAFVVRLPTGHTKA